jgi:hypothetical protein
MLRAAWQSERGGVQSGFETLTRTRIGELGRDLLTGENGRMARFVSGRLVGRLSDWTPGSQTSLDHPSRSRS